VKIEKWFRF